jgi:hypothetical protein
MPVWVLAVLLLAGGRGPAPAAHPLHSALAEIEYQPEIGSLIIRVRAFRDDLAAATSGSSDSLPADSVLSRYVRQRLTLSDSQGRQLSLQWQSAHQEGDMVLLELGANISGGLRHAWIRDALLWECFPDQVNIVRASYEGRTVTLLFTEGDSAKALP